MNRHPFLRAYLAGICIPTIFLLIVAAGFTLLRYVYNFPVPVERVIVFPMAVVPNLWGLWNILFLVTHERLHLSLGLHGAILPLLLAPLGLLAASLINFSITAFALHLLPYVAPIALILYYLVWKYFVAALNAELGIA